tara:strand:+ start:1897 stop:2160 length:264 start_codon:yes stop_codon:yes gene_type:complete
MDYKKILLASATKMATNLVDDATDKYKEQMITYIKSDEFEELVAETMDKAINIPFVKDEKEGPFFRDVADSMQNIFVKVMQLVMDGK